MEVHARNVGGKADSGEVSDGTEEHAMGNEEAGVGSSCRAVGVILPTQRPEGGTSSQKGYSQVLGSNG